MNEELKELKEIIDCISYTVDKDMIDYFDSKFNLCTGYSNRHNIECESLEYILIKKGIITSALAVPGEKYSWRNDGIYKSLKIDFKRKPSAYNNVSSFKPKIAKESFELGELTHIVTFSTNIEAPLQVGMKLTFKCLRTYTVLDAINAAYDTRNGYHLLRAI